MIETVAQRQIEQLSLIESEERDIETGRGYWIDVFESQRDELEEDGIRDRS